MQSLPKFSDSRVLIVGDVMLDRYWHGPCQRVSPEAPVPVVKVTQRHNRPGGAGNVALNLAALTGQATLLGLIGQDEQGEQLTQLLSTAGVHCQFQQLVGHPTTTKLRVISQQQQLLRMDFESVPANSAECDALFADYQKALANCRVVVLSDYHKGVLSEPRLFIEAARKEGRPVLVDPKGDNFDKYQGATLLTPNRREFEQVVGPCVDEQQLVEKGMAAIEQHGLQALLVTRGEQGMTLLQRDKAPLHLPAKAREVFDVTGAGDTVIAVLAACLSAGESLARATELANLAAGIVVSHLGAASITEAELKSAVTKQTRHLQAICDQGHLQAQLAEARAQGERIVMTNGCFDLLHAGHVQYLAQAKALGDRLVVAVNDDDSVKRLKGKSRPINPVERRMAVLAGLEAVDWVVPFSEDTPINLIKAINPNVLVKGGDYKDLSEVVGSDHVMAQGGDVKILPFKTGCSTTAIVEAIQEDAS